MLNNAPHLFLHGSAETHQCWDGILQAAGEIGPVIRSDELVTIDALRAAASELPDACHVIGHSYGGVLATILALEQPEKVARLTLIEPVIFLLLQGRDDAALDATRSVAQIFTDFDPCDADNALRALLDYWFGNGMWERAPENLRQLMRRDAAIIHNQINHAATWEPPVQLIEALPMPVKLIAGAETRDSAASITRILSTLIPNSDYKIVAAARHDLIRTHPKELAELIGLRTTADNETTRTSGP